MARAYSARGRPASPKGWMGRYRVTEGGSSSASFHHYRADRYRPQYRQPAPGNRQSRPICWDCGTPGHTWRHCQQPINQKSNLERPKPFQTNEPVPKPHDPEPNHKVKSEPKDRATPLQVIPQRHGKPLVDSSGQGQAIGSLKAYLARIVLHGIEDARALNPASFDSDEDASFEQMAVDLITDGLVTSWVGILSSNVLMSVNDTVGKLKSR